MIIYLWDKQPSAYSIRVFNKCCSVSFAARYKLREGGYDREELKLSLRFNYKHNTYTYEKSN